MSKKLKTCRGVSIAEMLVAVVLLALLTAGGITAASAVMASYNRMKEAANADILASTVIEAISNEVRLGRNIVDPADPAAATYPDDHLTLDSAFFGEEATLQLDADGRLVAQPKGTTLPDDQKALLSDDTYNGLKLTGLEFEKDGAGTRTAYVIRFSVCNSADDVLWSGQADAAPMQ